jgi:hypothetical protein
MNTSKKEIKRVVGKINRINDKSFHEKIAEIIFNNNPKTVHSFSGDEILINIANINNIAFDKISSLLDLYNKNEEYSSNYNKSINMFKIMN